MPKVSVVVPVYNVESYLPQCVESLLSQTLSDMEIILVNDASTDGSLAILHSYEKKDPRVVVIDKPHGGLGDTRNWGVRAAKGEYLSFVDSDDWVDADMLEELYTQAAKQEADLAVFNFIRENEETGEKRECRLPVQGVQLGGDAANAALDSLIGPDPAGTPWREVEMLGSAWRRLYRRDWFVENSLSYPNEQKVMLEDLPVSIRAHVQARRVLFLPGCYYHYRYNPTSLSIRYRPRKIEMLTACYHDVEDFLEEAGLQNAYGERHLAWFLRMASHSALVNCFSPKNPAGAKGRRAEVSGILHTPLFQEALRSNYLMGGTRADRVLLRILRTGNTRLIYAFYQLYSHILLKDTKRK